MKNSTILIKLNRPAFQYEVHSLVHAFYPQCKVKVTGDPASSDKDQDGASFLLSILFTPDDPPASLISILFAGQEEPLLENQCTCEEEDKKETKNRLKRLLYQALVRYTGKTLPWGDLTGIRPVKIPMKLLKEAKTDEEIAQTMRSTYLVSDEKIALATDIARRELFLLDRMDLERKDAPYPALFNGYSLYVGIPFCPSICLYCSFSSSPIGLWKDQVDDYLDALCYEIREVSKIVKDKRPDTLYIGGGTPTTLTPGQLERLFQCLDECFDLDGVKEFTVEAGRPDTITEEKLQVLKDYGVTRISINPQTMNQDTLDFIGRKHTVEQIHEAYALARSMGFDNINMDTIVGLPGEHLSEVKHTMETLCAMDPQSITVHSLAVKRAARLRLFTEEHEELSFENSQAIMDMTADKTRGIGMHPYYLYRQKNMAGNFENVGYAKEGCEGLYNVLIMEEVQTILALGAGGSSKLVFPSGRIERVENVKDIKNYMDRTSEMVERKKNGLRAQEEKR